MTDLVMEARHVYKTYRTKKAKKPVNRFGFFLLKQQQIRFGVKLKRFRRGLGKTEQGEQV